LVELSEEEEHARWMQFHERCLREREDELAFRELEVERQAKLRWSDFFGDYAKGCQCDGVAVGRRVCS
jgi:hypothetical protein